MVFHDGAQEIDGCCPLNAELSGGLARTSRSRGPRYGELRSSSIAIGGRVFARPHLACVDFAEVTCLALAASLGDRNCVACLCGIDADESFAMMSHDSPSLHGALLGPNRATLGEPPQTRKDIRSRTLRHGDCFALPAEEPSPVWMFDSVLERSSLITKLQAAHNKPTLRKGANSC
jgi:hypothetical protein